MPIVIVCLSRSTGQETGTPSSQGADGRWKRSFARSWEWCPRSGPLPLHRSRWRSTDALVRQASAIDEPWIPSDLVQSKDELFYHPTQKQVVARRRRYYGDLILSETPVAIEDQVAASEVLYEAIRNDLRNVLPGDQETVSAWLVRARCLRLWAPELELPNFDDTFLLQVLRQLCGNAKGIEDVRKGPWLDWMMGEMNPDQARAIQQETPERIQVPSGNWIRLQYQEGAPPILAVRIQEVFSWKTTLELLSEESPFCCTYWPQT